MTNDEIRDYLNERCLANEFAKNCGMRIDEVKKPHIVMSMPITKALTNIYGIAHGGSLSTLADTCIGLTCFVYGKRVVTVDMTMNFLKGLCEGERAIATSTILHHGRTTFMGEATITNEQGELMAKCSGTFFVIADNLDLSEHW